MDSRKRCSYFRWFPTGFFKGLTRSVLCSVAYVHLGISISSYFNFILFSFSFIFCFANPLVRLGPHSSCIVRLAFIEKIENTKILFFWCDILRQRSDWFFIPRAWKSSWYQQRPPCEHSHLSSTERILVRCKTNTEPWSGSLKRFSFQERNYATDSCRWPRVKWAPNNTHKIIY